MTGSDEEGVRRQSGQEGGAWLRAILPVAQKREHWASEVEPCFHPCPGRWGGLLALLVFTLLCTDSLGSAGS